MIKIGTLAKLSGLTVETLRFYEQKDLLRPATRSTSGYRLYKQDDVELVQFILRAKKLGFTLHEIKDLLSINLNKDDHTCSDVKSFTEEKIEQVQERIVELQIILTALQRLHDACCGGDEKATHCSILSALGNQAFDQSDKR